MKGHSIYFRRPLLALSPEGESAAAAPVVPPVEAPVVTPPVVDPPVVPVVEPPVVPVVPPTEPPAEVKFDLKLPEQSTLDATALERTAAIARELGLSDNAAAQKVVDFLNQEVASVREAAIASYAPGGAEWAKMDESYRAAALADDVLGGNKPEQLQANVALASRVLAKFGDDQSREFLEKSGLGSHPGALRLLVRIGQAMSEASLVTEKTPASVERTQEEKAAKLYPTMAKS